MIPHSSHANRAGDEATEADTRQFTPARVCRTAYTDRGRIPGAPPGADHPSAVSGKNARYMLSGPQLFEVMTAVPHEERDS